MMKRFASLFFDSLALVLERKSKDSFSSSFFFFFLMTLCLSAGCEFNPREALSDPSRCQEVSLFEEPRAPPELYQGTGSCWRADYSRGARHV